MTEAYGASALLPRPALQPAGAPSSAQVAALLATEPPAAKEPEAAPSADEGDIFEDAKESLHDDADPLYEKRLEAIKAGAKMRPAGWLHPAAFHANQKRAKKEAQRAKKAQVAATAALPAEETAEVAALLAEAVPDPGPEDETAPPAEETAATPPAAGETPAEPALPEAALLPEPADEVTAPALSLEVLEPQDYSEQYQPAAAPWKELKAQGDYLYGAGHGSAAVGCYKEALDAYYAADPVIDGTNFPPDLLELCRARLNAVARCELEGDNFLERHKYAQAAACYEYAMFGYDAYRRQRPPELCRKLEEASELTDELDYQYEEPDYKAWDSQARSAAGS